MVEVESDGGASETARKFLRSLKKHPPPLGGALDSKRVGVLALARNVCAFSARSGGSNKYCGAAKLQKALIDAGATLLVPMGSAEVEMEEVEVSIIPWVKTVADACAVVHATPWTANAVEHARPAAASRCDLPTVEMRSPHSRDAISPQSHGRALQMHALEMHAARAAVQERTLQSCRADRPTCAISTGPRPALWRGSRRTRRSNRTGLGAVTQLGMR